MGCVVQPNGVPYWEGNSIEVKAGKWRYDNDTKEQPVVFLSFNERQCAVLNYDTLTQLIDLLCKHQERLREKIFKHPELVEKVMGLRQ